jgi:hypothetical protein
MMIWRRQKIRRADIPPDVRRELEGYGELAVQAALSHPFDVPTSPMFSLRHEHKEHTLAWLAEKREKAEGRMRNQKRWAIAGVAIGALALLASATSAYYAHKNFKLQTASNHPELTFTQLVLRNPPDEGLLNFAFRNVGTRQAENLKIVVRTVDPNGERPPTTLAIIFGGNSIPKDATREAHQKIDIKRFLGVLVFCTEYADQAGNQYRDVSFYQFPNVDPQRTKEQGGGGGEYGSMDISPDMQRKLEKLPICK